MIQHSLLFTVFLFFTTSNIWSQPDWRSIVSSSFAELEQEATDSMMACRADAEKIRKEMNDLLDDMGLTRKYILGNDDEYFKEGMHKNFTKAPVALQVQIKRDQRMVRFEESHRLLYHRDKNLFYWLKMQERLQKHKERTDYTSWGNTFNNLPDNQSGNLKSTKKKIQWVKDQVICGFARTMETSNPNASKKQLDRFEPKFDPAIWEADPSEPFEKRPLPCPPEDILCSFPVNGQFAFHPSESIPKIGYMAIANRSVQPIMDYRYNDHVLKARWMGTNGNTIYTAAEYRALERALFYVIPDYLEPTHIYRLQIIAIPEQFTAQPLTTPLCWDIYRGRNTEERQALNASIEGEKILAEIYFRAGKYTTRQKLETMKGEIDWENGTIVFDSDEPLDPFEMYGNPPVAAPVNWRLLPSFFYKIMSAINSDEVLYYLSVPHIEPTENVPLSKMLVAELDNTLDAPFVRKTSLGWSKGYRKAPEVVETDTPLPGGYTAPALARKNVADSLITELNVPFISKDYFDAKQPLNFSPTRCTLKIGEFKQLLNAAKLSQNQLIKRVEERVDFFYALEKRRADRAGKEMTITREQLMEEEMKNLPKKVKELLDAEIPECFQENFTAIFIRFFPGTKRHSAELTLKLEE